MRHASQRLVSNTAKKTAISTSHLKQFPPKEALFKHGQFPSQFSPDVWPSLQPPTPASLSAFAHRLGLAPILDTAALTQQVCTHPSFVPFHQRYYPNETAPASNAQLAALGNSLMGLFASEYLHAQYPYIPTRVLKALVTAHVGPLTTATVAQEMGAQSLLRWHRAVCAAFIHTIWLL
jgi:large subunit ribosomal protein L44